MDACMPIKQMKFENLVGKKESLNGHDEQFLHLLQCFQLYSIIILSFTDISYFFYDYVFKTVCCIFVVCGKGLKSFRSGEHWSVCFSRILILMKRYYWTKFKTKPFLTHAYTTNLQQTTFRKHLVGNSLKIKKLSWWIRVENIVTKGAISSFATMISKGVVCCRCDRKSHCLYVG